MDHDEVREQLQLAAVEPDGLDRLMAGDTPMAAAIAAHLAGCDACTTELERLRRGVPLIRDVVRTSPPADLRERTLAYVRAQGIQRGPAATTPTDVPAIAPVAPVRAYRGTLRWVAAIAAAVVIAVAGTSYIVGSRLDSQLAAQAAQLAAQAETNRDLANVTMATTRVAGEKDAKRVMLTGTSGSASGGTLLFSPATSELVVVASGLARPPAGQEYRCWVEVGGTRQAIGKMFFAGDVAYWIGDVTTIWSVPNGSRFGVSLTVVGGTTPDREPVIAGTL